MIKFSENEIFLVTGGSSGLGKAIALKINELGGTVIAVARNKEKLEKIKDLSNTPQKMFFEVKDLTEDIENLPNWVLGLAQKYGKMRGLILSAGIMQMVSLRAFDVERAKQLFDINYFSDIALCKGFCNKKVVVNEGGGIVFISSISSIRGRSGVINYSASKGAIDSAVKAMAVEVARNGIRVNSILPGLVDTEMKGEVGDNIPPERLNEILNKHILGLGKPEDIANITCFLLSNNARWITGQCFVVDGGASLS
ncbi:hypothetical protein A2276_05930 [candidate division WOR-1 bacterium RIFOXYA12_FULL_43_27]|uniref:Short-chain dehydrogenase n=1 Tax=candidate division WOR-1 bacterium RIFOXYC2_FULL_46_14 TaxID=1802587 RepID=A0A1F4U3C0_UNCSA|nr:MAG: hypothetical protein A2276_05930 [candidate division WOR-1 bacterium RIFOXYA12_FULL_43_27]OGC20200.1 MAG: hypothetical protein A2292_03930 [candidate division WOR-1 bacterium RIFOXYB2_FULL_46_45]OGC32062.1 MAG: hypothetical protein A2232_07515 [candidate division WOR-1 bacterium RIFOXYA2_FULL_46_56]OGC39464.1 MAG: hypothetical protein A2438_07880 [candidate division WOR-1 bacterium RIFOXYC2_FULL_46_14]